MSAQVKIEPSTTQVGANAVVGVYRSHVDADDAVRRLERAGFDMKKLSVVGRGYNAEQHPVGYYNTGDRMLQWGKFGAFWGGIWGLLFGSAFFWIPGIGPLLLGGPLVSALVGALEGAVVVGGLSALGAALYSIGIPKDSVIEYETAVNADKYLVIVHGPVASVDEAKSVLESTNPEKVNVHGVQT
jgi:hypothetical protein